MMLKDRFGHGATQLASKPMYSTTQQKVDPSLILDPSEEMDVNITIQLTMDYDRVRQGTELEECIQEGLKRLRIGMRQETPFSKTTYLHDKQEPIAYAGDVHRIGCIHTAYWATEPPR